MSSRPLSSLRLPRSTLSALTRAGYETLGDLQSASVEELAQELGIALPAVELIFSSSQKPQTSHDAPPSTQSAASMVKNVQRFSTRSAAFDKILLGGITRGHILEISGPPGTPKETVATNIATSFVEAGEGVIFVDAQNMTSPASLDKSLRLSRSLPTNYTSLVYHCNVRTLPDLMVLIHNIPSILDAHPKVSLLVLNSISFFFQAGQKLTVPARTSLLERIKKALAVASGSRNLTIVSTSQLATKILNADGSPGSFDTGAKGVMVPQLGPAYLPSGRSHRIIIVPNSKNSGFIKLLSSPTYQGKGPTPITPYEMSIDGQIS